MRRMVITAAVALAALGVAAPASADVSYAFRFSLDTASDQSTESLATSVADSFGTLFPLPTDCAKLPAVGAECAFGTDREVLVDKTPTGWTFRSLAGHSQGADRYVSVAFERDSTGAALSVHGWGGTSQAAAANLLSGDTYNAWVKFARNISGAY